MNVLQVTFYGVYNVLLGCSGNTRAHTCVGAYGDERRTSGVLLRSHPPGCGGQDLSLVWSSSHKVGWLACELQRSAHLYLLSTGLEAHTSVSAFQWSFWGLNAVLTPGQQVLHHESYFSSLWGFFLMHTVLFRKL